MGRKSKTAPDKLLQNLKNLSLMQEQRMRKILLPFQYYLAPYLLKPLKSLILYCWFLNIPVKKIPRIITSGK